MRLFIAINLPSALQSALQAQAAALEPVVRAVHAKVGWVRPDHYHLTLRFLGEFPEERVPDLGRALAESLEETVAFDLRLQGWGCFPTRGMPHTLWIGAAGPGGSLEGLGAGIQKALRRLDFADVKRSFHAHVTVGRVRFVKDGKRLRTIVSELPSSAPLPWRVDALDLMQSVLHPEGPAYTCLKPIPLREGGRPVL